MNAPPPLMIQQETTSRLWFRNHISPMIQKPHLAYDSETTSRLWFRNHISPMIQGILSHGKDHGCRNKLQVCITCMSTWSYVHANLCWCRDILHVCIFMYAYMYTQIHTWYTYTHKCINTYMHQHIYIHTCIYIHVYIYTHTHITHTYVHVYTCMYAHNHMFALTKKLMGSLTKQIWSWKQMISKQSRSSIRIVCARVRVCRTYVHTYICRWIHTYIHAYIQTYTYINSWTFSYMHTYKRHPHFP
jgi:hypothetical protein